jgi:thioesterase domain-containing protein
MSRRLGRALSLLELFQNPTIESLARRLRGRREAEPAAPRSPRSPRSPLSPIVVLQGAGDRRPFFCVHPGGGTVLAYVPLSRSLGSDRPFYGLQAAELPEGRAPDDTVEAMAARYVAALREVQPAGPYLLGGWSLGGVVAYEMALQLREMGETIELLALIDAHAPMPAASLSEDGDLALLASFAQNLGLPLEQLPLTAAEVKGMSPDERMALVVEQARRFRVLPPDYEAGQLAQLFRLFSRHVRALMRYTPRSYDGCLTLYRVAREEANGQDALGWRGLALRGVKVRDIPGTHFTALREPHVVELAARLAEDLP